MRITKKERKKNAEQFYNMFMSGCCNKTAIVAQKCVSTNPNINKVQFMAVPSPLSYSSGNNAGKELFRWRIQWMVRRKLSLSNYIQRWICLLFGKGLDMDTQSKDFLSSRHMKQNIWNVMKKLSENIWEVFVFSPKLHTIYANKYDDERRQKSFHHCSTITEENRYRKEN